MSPATDHQVLIGLLALHHELITREQLIAAMNTWVSDKSRSLNHILLDQDALNEDTNWLLAAILDKHLARHDGDLERSLASLRSIGSLAEQLKSLGDHHFAHSLTLVAENQGPLESPADQPTTHDAGLTRYRVLRPHARGGLGEVSVAVDTELNREVALKEIQQRFADDPNSRARFVMEAEVTGALEHPGIIPVYGLGQYADGRPFYAMRLIRGDSLQEALDRYHRNGEGEASQRVGLRKLLQRFVDVCQAIEYAHSRGVLHRDLKPGNVMLGKYGETLVVDWGLAKPTETIEARRETTEPALRPASGSGSTPTQMGTALGTPAFMSPEQAAGRLQELGPATDVYSLGATLYVLLTGRLPITDSDLQTVLQKAQAGDFAAPRRIKASVPKPLEAICLKAMNSSPSNRYSSPQAVADDIERWLADEPVSAYRENLTELACRFVARRRSAVLAAGAVLLFALIGVTVVTVVVNQANQRITLARVQAEQSLYIAHMNLVQQSVESADMVQAIEYLQRHEPRGARRDLRRFEWYYWRSRCRIFRHMFEERQPVLAIAFHPDGDRLATAGEEGSIRLWSLSQEKLIRRFEGHTAKVTGLAIAPDGRSMASTSMDHTCRIWDLETGELQQRLEGDRTFRCPAFSPNGRVLATGDNGDAIRLWDPVNGTLQQTLLGHTGDVYAIAFSPVSNLLASASGDRSVRLWDVGTYQCVSTFSGHRDKVRCVAFSSDGSRLASGSSDSTIILWNLDSQQPERRIKGHEREVYDLDFSPDGLTLSTAGRDETIRLWSVVSGEELHTIRGHLFTVYRVRFSPDGQTLASAGHDKTIKLWNLAQTQLIDRLTGHHDAVTSVVFAADRRTLFSAGADGTICRWDTNSPVAKAPWGQHESGIWHLQLSPDGSQLASSSEDGSIKLWSTNSGEPIHSWQGHQEDAFSVAFSPDGTLLASAGADGQVKLWNVSDGHLVHTLSGHTDWVYSVEFSPDGSQLATASADESVRIWTLTTGRVAAVLRGHVNRVYTARFSPDGELLATGGQDRAIRLWDVAAGEELRRCNGHAASVHALLFSHDGRTLFSGSSDRLLKTWDVQTGDVKTTLDGHDRQVMAISLSADGQTLASAGADAVIRLWRAPVTADE